MRRNYVVTYDIADDKRRTTVFKTLHGYGDHVQYSVFFCALNQRELIQLRGRLRAAIHHDEDQVLLVDVGRARRTFDAALDVVGRAYVPATRTIVI